MTEQPYFTIRSRRPAENSRSAEPGPSGDIHARSATHDVSRTNFHVKHIGQFAQRLEDSAARAFPNRGRSSQRYSNVQALLLHWNSDDLFVIPELEDMEKCLSEDYGFNTDIFGIPSENSHLELMLRIGQLIKDHESTDTLFIVYYGGHARIDESRQSTWCATREPSSPWLQWSAIQTLLERSTSDVLILLDCCAGAASATFPNGSSITETISASSWDAIAPDPGRYSFTNALIEVLQEWRIRAFSAAMLHAEVLARLKHPRPITINGKYFEARSTPVHFMMTSNHKAPSIELSRTLQGGDRLPSPDIMPTPAPVESGRAPDLSTIARNDHMFTEPNEDTPHVMISLALEDDQRLDINAWEQWLGAFPAMAKYVKVQGVFKSHSTLLLVSMPVSIWDLLPEDHATSFVAFIRSNNLMTQKQRSPSVPVFVPARSYPTESTTADSASLFSGVSGTTFAATENMGVTGQIQGTFREPSYGRQMSVPVVRAVPGSQSLSPIQQSSFPGSPPLSLPAHPVRPMHSATSLASLQRQQSTMSLGTTGNMSRQIIMNQQQALRRTTFGGDVPEPKKFSAHVEKRLEEYYQDYPLPNDGQKAFFASNLGVEPWHVEVWFHHRREKDAFAQRFASLQMEDTRYQSFDGPRMILPGNLNELLEISLPGQALLIDLRSLTEYQRSHIKGAIHLRAPQSFLRPASLDMVERAFADAQSRRIFSHWQRAKCIVFYARGLESPAECLPAETILEKLWAAGWQGQSFILKGHYREFSDSFGKHIKRADADDLSEGQHKGTSNLTPEDISANQQRYAEFLSRLGGEEQVQYPATMPMPSDERTTALAETEKELETEFQTRFPALYKKAQDMHGTGVGNSDADSFVTKAQMVEYLDRGLTKIRDNQPPTASSPIIYEPGHSNRIIGAVLNSFGLGNQTVTSGPRSMTSTPPANAAGEVSQGTDTEGTRGNVSGRGQAGGQMHPGQPFPNHPLPSLPQALRLNGAAVPVPSLHMPIPDSLNTLSEFINRMEVTLSVYGNQQNSSPNSAGETRFNLPSNAQGLPTPEALNVILRRAQQLLMDHAATSLSHIAGRLEGEGASTDPAVRSQIQAESVQIGLAMQHLGALFLELGRTILTLRMGNSSAESVVNAGPAVYISPSGPNPIMVQPFPLQTNSLLAGASAAPQANPVVLGPTGFGDVPRHINIHIHAGSSLAPGLSSVSSRATPGEGTQGGRPSGTGTGDSGSTRVLPVRNVIAAAVPAHSTEGRGHILSTLYPLQTRSQQTNPSNSTSTQNPSVAVSNTAQPGVVVSVPQPPLESYSLPTIVAEVSSCMGNIVADLPRENPVPSGQLEASTVQGLSVGSEVGSDALDRQNNSLAVNGAGETHVSESEGQGPQLECCVSGNHDDTDGGSTLKDASTYSVGTSCGFPSGENLLPPQPEVDSDNAPRSSQGQDPPEGVKAVPLGLGMGDLKPRRRSKQTKLQGKDGGGGIPCVPPNSQDQQATSNHRFLHSLESPGSSGSMTDVNAPPIFGQGRENMALGGQGSNGQFDVSMMSQVLDNPVLNGLLTGVSEQVGVGSPNILRNMLQQLAQSPPMRNTLNQIAQQIEGQDTESMFSGLGRGQGGGMDLSRMVQHMMPIVSQVLTRGSTNSQPFSGVQHEQLQQFNGTGSGGDNKQADKNSQIDLTGAARSIECHESPGNIFRAVVDSAVHLCGVENCSESLLEELCTNDDLVREFMEMLYHDIHRRLEADSESTGKS